MSLQPSNLWNLLTLLKEMISILNLLRQKHLFPRLGIISLNLFLDKVKMYWLIRMFHQSHQIHQFPQLTTFTRIQMSKNGELLMAVGVITLPRISQWVRLEQVRVLEFLAMEEMMDRHGQQLITELALSMVLLTAKWIRQLLLMSVIHIIWSYWLLQDPHPIQWLPSKLDLELMTG
jgi:hypothetical protein